MPVDGITITVHDPRLDPEDVIAERVALGNLIQARVLPDEEPTRVEDAVAASRAIPERVRSIVLAARDADGLLVGTAGTSVDPDERENTDVLWTRASVHPDHRRRGIGSALIAGLLDVAEAEGRTTIIGHTFGVEPAGGAFAAAMGAEAKSRSHVNHLRIADVDRALLERWVAEAADRAAGYELLGWDGSVPDDHVDRWIQVALVMNTAPRDDLELEDSTITPQELRDHEAMRQAIGDEHWVLVARHVESGEWVGAHDVHWVPADPHVVQVGFTAVDPTHRGHALGKWLKAAMTLRILDERPDVVDIRTENADSNDAMLGINRAMGYQPWIDVTTWAVDGATARSRLRS